jgi:hypothetical protein
MADTFRDQVPVVLHMNGANASTTFTNNGYGGYSTTVTIVNTIGVPLTTTAPKYGAACGSFNGTTHRLQITGLSQASQSMVIEGWIYPTSLSASTAVPIWFMGPDGSSNGIIQCGIYSTGAVQLYCSTTAGAMINQIFSPVSTIAINTWYHLAIVINIETGMAYIYVNGTSVGLTSAFLTAGQSPANFYIGYGRWGATNIYFPGKMDDFRVTYGADRYTANFTAPAAELSDLADYINTVSETISTLSVPDYYLSKIELLSESIVLTHSESLSTTIYLLESLVLSLTSVDTLNSSEVLVDVISTLDSLVLLIYGSISESIVTSSTFSSLITQIENVIDYVIKNSSLSSKTILLESLSNAISLLDSIDYGVLKTISDVVNLTHTSLELSVLLSTLLDSITTSSSLSNSYISIVGLSETILHSSIVSNTTDLSSKLLDSFIINISSSKGTDKYLAYLLSPETNSVSTYNNYNFDGCAKGFNKYLFYNSTGLYEYGSSTDNGTIIRSEIETVAFNFNTSNLKQVPSIYLGQSSSGPSYLKVKVDGKGEFLYKLNKNTNDLQTQKVALGKGLIGRYFEFELINESSEFSMESIEFYPIELKRKL